MFAPYRFEGYAIVSSDGMIADADGAFPEALVFKADQRFSSANSTMLMR